MAIVTMPDGVLHGSPERPFLVIMHVEPVYCPMCGYPIMRNALAEEAERVLEDSGR